MKNVMKIMTFVALFVMFAATAAVALADVSAAEAVQSTIWCDKAGNQRHHAVMAASLKPENHTVIFQGTEKAAYFGNGRVIAVSLWENDDRENGGKIACNVNVATAIMPDGHINAREGYAVKGVEPVTVGHEIFVVRMNGENFNRLVVKGILAQINNGGGSSSRSKPTSDQTAHHTIGGTSQTASHTIGGSSGQTASHTIGGSSNGSTKVSGGNADKIRNELGFGK